MTQEAAAVEHQTEHRKRPRGVPWRPGQSGNPLGGSFVGKTVLALYDEMAKDFATLSGTDSVMLMQAARLLARSQRTKDAAIAVRLSNGAARLLASVTRNGKREPSASGPTLQEYLRDRYGTERPTDESKPGSASGIAAGEETRASETPTADGDDSSDDDSNADEAMS